MTAPRGGMLQAGGLSRVIGGRALWRDLALAIRPGERWAIAGPSGSGKTLLLRTLAGLEPRTGGVLCLDGRPFEHWWPPAWRARVIYLAQRPALPEGTVEAALAAPLRLRVHRGKTHAPGLIRRRLDAIGVDPGFLTRATAELSGGEAQVVATLRALLLEPAILLLDEPTASLDAARTACIEALVDDWLNATDGRAALWTSHDQTQIARVSERVLRLGTPA